MLICFFTKLGTRLGLATLVNVLLSPVRCLDLGASQRKHGSPQSSSTRLSPAECLTRGSISPAILGRLEITLVARRVCEIVCSLSTSVKSVINFGGPATRSTFSDANHLACRFKASIESSGHNSHPTHSSSY